MFGGFFGGFLEGVWRVWRVLEGLDGFRAFGVLCGLANGTFASP